MSLVETLLVVLLLGVALAVTMLLALLARARGDGGVGIRLDALKDDGARLERTLREEQRAGREEL